MSPHRMGTPAGCSATVAVWPAAMLRTGTCERWMLVTWQRVKSPCSVGPNHRWLPTEMEPRMRVPLATLPTFSTSNMCPTRNCTEWSASSLMPVSPRDPKSGASEEALWYIRDCREPKKACSTDRPVPVTLDTVKTGTQPRQLSAVSCSAASCASSGVSTNQTLRIEWLLLDTQEAEGPLALGVAGTPASNCWSWDVMDATSSDTARSALVMTKKTGTSRPMAAARCSQSILQKVVLPSSEEELHGRQSMAKSGTIAVRPCSAVFMNFLWPPTSTRDTSLLALADTSACVAHDTPA
mmetsp:Transcript_30248/g.85495  ORF Transcript_30248/g.85495 Transcript_30248/m.85495 type:complete len:296 (+) Transcript_30248:515-1402(+)